MDIINNIGLLLGSSWASGVNLYMSVALLGISDRLGWIELPGEMHVLSNLFIIAVAVVLYAIEFVADKIPYVDSAWDTVHTFVRPFGSAAMGYMAMSNMGPAAQIPVALLAGAVAADSHLTKATTRVAINTSPEPFSNIAASLTEDALVLTVIWLVIKHPIVASICVILFILFSIWFLRVMFRFVKKVFGAIFGLGRKPQPAQ